MLVKHRCRNFSKVVHPWLPKFSRSCPSVVAHVFQCRAFIVAQAGPEFRIHCCPSFANVGQTSLSKNFPELFNLSCPNFPSLAHPSLRTFSNVTHPSLPMDFLKKHSLQVRPAILKAMLPATIESSRSIQSSGQHGLPETRRQQPGLEVNKLFNSYRGFE